MPVVILYGVNYIRLMISGEAIILVDKNHVKR